MTQIDFQGLSCPVPLRDHPNIVMGHGGGGRLGLELVEHLFMPAFTRDDGAAPLLELGDCAVLAVGGARLAFSTDSYIVRPRFFPGGNIGHLAVHGTMNDLACSGARPLYLSAGFILEEGMPLDELTVIAETMGRAAREAGVQIVTGDTKVVDAGKGDGVFINTAGIGLVPAGVQLSPRNVRPGDAVIVSGPIGQHGIAVMSVREGLEFGIDILSDTAPIHGLVAALLDAGIEVHAFRDPTRGGVAATTNEIAKSSKVGFLLQERAIPVPDAVAAACGFLGLDPMYVANEGRVVAFVAAQDAERALAIWHGRDDGAGAARIGTAVEEHPGVVVVSTGIGGSRVLDLPLAEQLPRIC